MKTVEILAKQLNSWPSDTTYIFMSPDSGVFFGYRVGHEHPQHVNSECLAGHQPADDAGTMVNELEFNQEKLRRCRIPQPTYTYLPSEEQQRRDDLYRIKLQCLADVLSKESVVHKQDALLTAKAINAAFDEITF